MKKVIMVAAIVCAATFAQAVNCQWNSYAYAQDWQTALSDGSYWLVALGTSDAGLSDLVVKQDGSVDFGSYTTVASGKITDAMGGVSGSIDNLFEKDNGSYYALVVWDGVLGEDGMYGTASGMVSGIADDPPKGTTIAFDNTGFGYGMTIANTATVAVPEPTSGLLLLLGMAGLALRRKQK